MADEPFPTSAVAQPIPEPTPPEKLHVEVPQPTPPEKLAAPQDVHSIPESGKESDRMMAALSYIPLSPLNFLFSVINLMGDKKYNKFHGGQSFGWFILGAVLAFASFFMMSFSVFLGPLALLLMLPVGLVFLIGFVLYPLYVGFKAFQGETILMPAVGNFVLEKLKMSLADVKA